MITDVHETLTTHVSNGLNHNDAIILLTLIFLLGRNLEAVAPRGLNSAVTGI